MFRTQKFGQGGIRGSGKDTDSARLGGKALLFCKNILESKWNCSKFLETFLT